MRRRRIFNSKMWKMKRRRRITKILQRRFRGKQKDDFKQEEKEVQQRIAVLYARNVNSQEAVLKQGRAGQFRAQQGGAQRGRQLRESGHICLSWGPEGYIKMLMKRKGPTARQATNSVSRFCSSLVVLKAGKAWLERGQLGQVVVGTER